MALHVKGVQQVILFGHGRVDIPPDARRNRQTAVDLPVVLQVKSHVPFRHAQRFAFEAHVESCGIAQKEVGGVMTGLRQGGRIRRRTACGTFHRSSQAVEVRSAGDVALVRKQVLLFLVIAEAELNVMRSFDDRVVLLDVGHHTVQSAPVVAFRCTA